MALTDQQYANLQNINSKITILVLKSNALSTMFSKIVNRADPADNLNDEVTMAGLQAKFSAQFAQLKADVLTAFNNIP